MSIVITSLSRKYRQLWRSIRNYVTITSPRYTHSMTEQQVYCNELFRILSYSEYCQLTRNNEHRRFSVYAKPGGLDNAIDTSIVTIVRFDGLSNSLQNELTVTFQKFYNFKNGSTFVDEQNTINMSSECSNVTSTGIELNELDDFDLLMIGSWTYFQKGIHYIGTLQFNSNYFVLPLSRLYQNLYGIKEYIVSPTNYQNPDSTLLFSWYIQPTLEQCNISLDFMGEYNKVIENKIQI